MTKKTLEKDMKKSKVSSKRFLSKVKTTDGHFGMPVTTDIETVYEKLTSGNYADRVKKIVQSVTLATLEKTPKSTYSPTGDALPYLLFGATFGKGGLDDLRMMTHMTVLSIDCQEGIGQVEQVKERVKQLPYTLLAFAGSSQKTLKVVVSCRYGDGFEPQTQAEYELFLQEAHQTAARLYEALTGCTVEPQAQGLLAGCRMSSDRKAYYQAEAQPVIVVRQNSYAPEGAEVTPNGVVDAGPSQQELEHMKMEYYACLDKAQEQSGDAEEMVQALAHYCMKAHLPEEFCLQETALKWVSIPVSEDLKRRIFRSIYKDFAPDGKPLSQMNDKERTARFIKEFFERRYELRYNEVKRIEEYRPANKKSWPWQPLTRRDLKRIAFEEMMEGGTGWMVDIETYVQSSLVQTYNPILEFLYACEKHYDPKTDYIGELARRVPTAYADWEKYFHRWFLAMVAQWTGRSRDFGNAMVPMLIGQQGTHKTTFCKLLLPVSLREYYMDDIKMDNAEQVERVLGRMALVNIDEYNAKTAREQAKIKRLLTERDVQVRQMRSEHYMLTSRLCSFIATTNDQQPLPAGDGTRRYLCVELTGTIDTETPINYARLYAQAMHELMEGEPFRFFPHEEAEIQMHNRPYQQQTSVAEVLLSYFAPAPSKGEFLMRAVDIQKQLGKHLKASDVPNIKLLTLTLKNCGFKKGAKKGQRGWYAKPITEMV